MKDINLIEEVNKKAEAKGINRAPVLLVQGFEAYAKPWEALFMLSRTFIDYTADYTGAKRYNKEYEAAEQVRVNGYAYTSKRLADSYFVEIKKRAARQFLYVNAKKEKHEKAEQREERIQYTYDCTAREFFSDVYEIVIKHIDKTEEAECLNNTHISTMLNSAELRHAFRWSTVEGLSTQERLYFEFLKTYIMNYNPKKHIPSYRMPVLDLDDFKN